MGQIGASAGGTEEETEERPEIKGSLNQNRKSAQLVTAQFSFASVGRYNDK
jgi:hypothetical protein